MTERVPSSFFLVPGPWSSTAAILDALALGDVLARTADGTPIADGEVRVTHVHESEGFGSAMRYGRNGPLPADLVVAASRCETAALLEIGGCLHDEVELVLDVARALRDAGGVGIRVEASGSASAWDPWLTSLEQGGPMGLVQAAVVVVGDEGDEYFTCGMHAFDLPDAQIALSAPDEAIEWLDVLCAFQIAEDPEIVTGHTFRPNAERARRRLERWPDGRHDGGDGRHNPYGLWRILPDDENALTAVDPILVPIPSLAAVLGAAERRAGRALLREEVETIRDRAAVVAMSLGDAIMLERSRGYADLEPRRAFDQWQIARAGIR